MDEFTLTQVVEEPTHHNNVLKLVFTTHPDLIEDTYVVESWGLVKFSCDSRSSTVGLRCVYAMRLL